MRISSHWDILAVVVCSYMHKLLHISCDKPSYLRDTIGNHNHLRKN